MYLVQKYWCSKRKKKKRLTRLLALHNLALHTAEMTVDPKAELTFTTCPKCFISGGNTILLHLFHSVSNCSMSNINQATYRSTEQWMLSTLNKEICPFRIHFCEVNLNSCISSTILLFFCNYFKAGDLKRPMVHMASQKRRGGRGGEEPSGKKKKNLLVFIGNSCHGRSSVWLTPAESPGWGCMIFERS